MLGGEGKSLTTDRFLLGLLIVDFAVILHDSALKLGKIGVLLGLLCGTIS